MGYDITIGELKVDKYPEEALEGSGLFFTAKSETHKDAPAFGEPTDYTNSRWPSYSAWSNFADYVGLADVLFDYRGNLVGGHPGVRLLTPEILAKITGGKIAHGGLVSTTATYYGKLYRKERLLLPPYLAGILVQGGFR